MKAQIELPNASSHLRLHRNSSCQLGKMAFEIEALLRRTDRRRGETFVVIVNDPPLRHQCLPVLQRAGMIASDLLNRTTTVGRVRILLGA